VGHPPRGLAERTQPLRLERPRTALVQRVRHLAQCGPQRLELRRAPPGSVRRQRFHAPNVTGPADQLVDRPAELARQVTSDPNRRVDQRRPEEQDHDAEAGVVVAPEGLDLLEPDEGVVELAGMGGEGLALGGGQPGRIQRLKQGAPRRAYILDGPEGAHGRRRGAHGEGPAEDCHGGGHRPEADQDEEDSLTEGEAHRP
jgi:hypothetical protein